MINIYIHIYICIFVYIYTHHHGTDASQLTNTFCKVVTMRKSEISARAVEWSNQQRFSFSNCGDMGVCVIDNNRNVQRNIIILQRWVLPLMGGNFPRHGPAKRAPRAGSGASLLASKFVAAKSEGR